MYRLSFYVPEPHLESVKAACTKAGAGKIGPYENCAWQTSGTGQYMPTEESKPYYGVKNKLEFAKEFKVEMVIADELVKDVLEAMLKAHPYETPAYGVWKILTIDDF